MDEHLLQIDLRSLMNADVIIETTEGSSLRGKLTKIHYRSCTILGKEVRVPMRIETNHDASDYTDWNLIKSIKLA